MWVLAQAVNYFFKVLDFLIIVRMILSFINTDPYGRLYRVVYQLTEPVLAPCRALLFKFGLGRGMIDFSPILAVFLLDTIKYFIITLIVRV